MTMLSSISPTAGRARSATPCRERANHSIARQSAPARRVQASAAPGSPACWINSQRHSKKGGTSSKCTSAVTFGRPCACNWLYGR